MFERVRWKQRGRSYRETCFLPCVVFCGPIRFVQGGGKRKTEKLGRLFGEEGDVMEEHERDQVEQNALQVSNG